jgi:hypothetical protein
VKLLDDDEVVLTVDLYRSKEDDWFDDLTEEFLDRLDAPVADIHEHFSLLSAPVKIGLLVNFVSLEFL